MFPNIMKAPFLHGRNRRKSCSDDIIEFNKQPYQLYPDHDYSDSDDDIKLSFIPPDLSIYILPAEVMECIASYLTPKTICRASKLSKKMKESFSTNKIWRDLVKRHFLIPLTCLTRSCQDTSASSLPFMRLALEILENENMLDDYKWKTCYSSLYKRNEIGLSSYFSNMYCSARLLPPILSKQLCYLQESITFAYKQMDTKTGYGYNLCYLRTYISRNGVGYTVADMYAVIREYRQWLNKRCKINHPRPIKIGYLSGVHYLDY